MFLKSSALLMICVIALQSCNTKQSETSQTIDSTAVNKIEKTSFGTLPDGQTASVFHLKNSNGMQVDISNYGGTIVNWTAPDKKWKI